MKHLLFFLLAVATFTACTPENPPSMSVTIDFSSAQDHTTIVFKGNNGQGTFTFTSDGSLVQTQNLPSHGSYNIIYTVEAVNPNSCQYWFDNMPVSGSGGSASEFHITPLSDYSFTQNCR
jgi:hypothetical protein